MSDAEKAIIAKVRQGGLTPLRVAYRHWWVKEQVHAAHREEMLKQLPDIPADEFVVVEVPR